MAINTLLQGQKQTITGPEHTTQCWKHNTTGQKTNYCRAINTLLWDQKNTTTEPENTQLKGHKYTTTGPETHNYKSRNTQMQGQKYTIAGP